MRIFLTGATGFIGSTIVPELINAGHQVLGLTRSETGAQALITAGAEAHRGDLEDLESLRRGAAMADGVIHTAFNHDFSNFVAICELDRRVIEAMGSVLVGSDRPFVITSGTGMGNAVPGQPAIEENFNPNHPNPRKASELAGVSVADRGVNVSVVRLPQIHDRSSRASSPTPSNWPVRRESRRMWVTDVNAGRRARPRYRPSLQVGFGEAEGSSRYHAVAEEGVPVRDIAEVIGRGLKVPVVSLSPEEAPAHFGWLSAFVGYDMPASSAQTQERLGWHPTGPGLIADLEQMQYS